MGSRVDAARAAARRSQPEARSTLDDWLRIRSVSGDPVHRVDVQRAAVLVARLLRTMTPRVRTLPGPVVLARIAGHGSRTAVVVYGHLDVRPAGPGWSTPPFRPTQVGRRLIARGASDDKGQLMAHLVALRAWQRVGGLPADVVVIVDGAEEVGSPGLRAALRQDGSLLARPAGAVLVSDTRMVAPGRPSLTMSQRGALALRVSVDVGGAPVHAGRFGGAVVDPSLVLAEILRTSARAVSATRPHAARALRPTDAEVRTAAGGRALLLDPAAGSTSRGALSVTGLRAGGTPGSVPTRARADLDVRLPAGARVEDVLAAVRAGVRRSRPRGVRVRVVPAHAVEGIRLEHPPQIREAVRRACVAGFGQPPVVVSSGGSIPAIGVLRDLCGVSPVLLGLGPADDGAHGPDEHLDLDDWVRSIDTSVVLLGGLASASHLMDPDRPFSGRVERLRPSADFRRLENETPEPCTPTAAGSGRPRGGSSPPSGGWQW
ncbi:MAG: dapE [Marmoricola sp.]|nr:dapE [Marmoricola sp.]